MFDLAHFGSLKSVVFIGQSQVPVFDEEKNIFKTLFSTQDKQD